MTIGVFGAATNTARAAIVAAREVGAALARHPVTLVTGACSGLPYAAAREAAGRGARVWGFSPMRDLEGQRRFTPDDDLCIYARLVFVPPSFDIDDLAVRKKYRNVVSTAHCDGAVVIGGRWGTLHEVCSLVDLGKVVGVLTGTGEVADALAPLVSALGSGTGATVLFDHRPDALVDAVVAAVARRGA